MLPHGNSDYLIDPARAGALLLAVQRGRDGALDELIHVCRPVVRLHARRFAWRASDVDDITQEVWLRVVQKAHQIRDPRALLAWLRVVTYRVANQLGHAGRRLVPAPDIDEDRTPTVVEDEVVDSCYREEGVRRMRLAVAELRPRDRELLMLLHRDRDPGYATVSKQVRRPIGSLGPTRRRLIERLRKDRHLVDFDLRVAS
jgi:RNA polymerase sigma factor (sigma-70 family)